MINYANSRLDYLRAQSLAQKVQMMPVQNPYNMVWNPQGMALNQQKMQQQPMMRPRYMSNMGGQRSSSFAIGRAQGGVQ